MRVKIEYSIRTAKYEKIKSDGLRGIKTKKAAQSYCYDNEYIKFGICLWFKRYLYTYYYNTYILLIFLKLKKCKMMIKNKIKKKMSLL